MVDKLNYSDLGVLAVMSNTKVLRKKHTNREGEDSSVEVRP
jgi:hypothetical protein